MKEFLKNLFKGKQFAVCWTFRFSWNGFYVKKKEPEMNKCPGDGDDCGVTKKDSDMGIRWDRRDHKDRRNDLENKDSNKTSKQEG